MSNSEKLQKHTLLLEEGQYAKLQELYPEIGAAKVIRALVRAHIAQVEPPIASDAITLEPTL